MINKSSLFRFAPVVAVLALFAAAGVVFAQIEGSDRGIAPIDSSGGLEVSGIMVDVSARSADAARFGGWREAQRKGWRMLWAKYRGGGAPGLSDGALDSIISSVVIEDEQISTNRYIARLGIIFDRVRAAEILGVGGGGARSAPMLVIPVLWDGGTPVSFEQRNEWQKAWATYRFSTSAIDYVRPSGTGADPLLLNFGQTGRPGRRWWRALLDQYGAADVLVPTVRLERQWPGGPVVGHFSARYGPDNRLLETFTLRVGNSAGIPKMMQDAISRIDGAYANALAAGVLRPDQSLVIEQPIAPEDVTPAEDAAELLPDASNEIAAPAEDPRATPEVSTFTIQFETPDVGSVSSTEGAVRGIPGVKSASTTSLALGGVSVMRVSFAGDAGMLRLGLAARGFSVAEGGGGFRISR